MKSGEVECEGPIEEQCSEFKTIAIGGPLALSACRGQLVAAKSHL